MALVFARSMLPPGDGTAVMASWDNLDESDTGPAAMEVTEYDSAVVQVIGTFNGGTVVLQGSNDGVNWATVQDIAGDAISLTAAGISSLRDLPRYLRPLVSAGTGLDIDVFLKLKRISSKRT